MIFPYPRPIWEFDYPKGKMIWLVKHKSSYLCGSVGPDGKIEKFLATRNDPKCLVFNSLWEAIIETKKTIVSNIK